MSTSTNAPTSSEPYPRDSATAVLEPSLPTPLDADELTSADGVDSCIVLYAKQCIPSFVVLLSGFLRQAFTPPEQVDQVLIAIQITVSDTFTITVPASLHLAFTCRWNRRPLLYTCIYEPVSVTHLILSIQEF